MVIDEMKRIQIILLSLLCIIPFTIIQVEGTLYVDASISDMDKIKDSKYKASAVSVVRNAEGELVSVVRWGHQDILMTPSLISS